MQPSEEAKRQFESKLKIGRLIGLFHFDGRVLHPRLIFVVLMGTLQQSMQLNAFTQSWPNIALICNSLGVYTLAVQLFVRLCSRFIMQDEKNFQSQMKTVMEFYEQEEKIPDHLKILAANLKIFNILLNSYMIFYVAIYSILNPTAWILSWYIGDFILYTPLYLPFTDPTILGDFIINSALLVFFTMFTCVCFMASDIYYILFVCQCVPMIDVYCIKLRKFAEDLLKGKKDKKPAIGKNLPSTSTQEPEVKDLKTVERQLVTLIKEFNVYNDYVRTTVNYMRLTTFTAISLNAMAIAMSTVVVLNYSKAIGGVMVMILFFQVLIPCIQGAVISHQKQKLLYALWDLPWYEMSNSSKKLFLQFMHLCQHSNEMQVPIIGSLSMEHFVTVINGAYSHLMFLLNVANKL